MKTKRLVKIWSCNIKPKHLSVERMDTASQKMVLIILINGVCIAQDVLTLDGHDILGPSDERFGFAAGSAGQHAIFSRRQNKVTGGAADPIRGSCKENRVVEIWSSQPTAV